MLRSPIAYQIMLHLYEKKPLTELAKGSNSENDL